MAIRDIIGANPSIDYGFGRGNQKRVENVKHAARVQDFFSDPERFQNFCNWQQNGVEPGMLMQVCISEVARRYPTSANPEEDICDFLINYKDYQGLCNYKTKKSTGVKAKGLQYKIYYAETRVIKKIAGSWGALTILVGDDYLSQSKSDEAFFKYSQLSGYNLAAGKSAFADVCLHVAGAREVTRRVRLTSAVNAQGETRYLIILLDNGKMLDLSPEQVTNVKYFEVPSFGVFKTELCFFQHLEGGNLQFFK